MPSGAVTEPTWNRMEAARPVLQVLESLSDAHYLFKSLLDLIREALLF